MDFNFEKQWDAVLAAPAIYILGAVAFLSLGFVAHGLLTRGTLSALRSTRSVILERLRLAQDQEKAMRTRGDLLEAALRKVTSDLGAQEGQLISDDTKSEGCELDRGKAMFRAMLTDLGDIPHREGPS